MKKYTFIYTFILLTIEAKIAFMKFILCALIHNIRFVSYINDCGKQHALCYEESETTQFTIFIMSHVKNCNQLNTHSIHIKYEYEQHSVSPLRRLRREEEKKKLVT